MSLLEQNTTIKGWVSKKLLELDVGNKDREKYKMEPIWDNVVYTKESKDHLPGLYYLIAWKGYPEEKST